MNSPQSLLRRLAAVFFLDAALLFGQPQERVFDAAPEEPRPLTIGILHPTPTTIENLIALRMQGLFPDTSVLVVGIFHEKELLNSTERTEYKRSETLVREKGLDWFHFHRIKGDLDAGHLFEENACTGDFALVFNGCDGLIFFGGEDIPPALYGDKTLLATDIVTPYRHYCEISFAFHLLGAGRDSHAPLLTAKPEFPVLGLCLGCQTLNVGAGGTLVQDIPEEVYHLSTLEDIISSPPSTWHRNPFRDLHPEEEYDSFSLHAIRLVESGLFCREWKFETIHMPLVYSSHHQSVKRLGEGMKIIATSLDQKVVEAIAHTAFPSVLGVQFHPEARRIWQNDAPYRCGTGDRPGKPVLEHFQDHPPTLLFHRLLWSWFINKAYRAYSLYQAGVQL